MFSTIYKTTVKNLFRSPIFWMMFAIFGFIAFTTVTQPSFGYYSREFNETIMDTDSRFVLEYITYVQRISNVVGGELMKYAMPLLIVVSVVLILNSDYGDNFYEIEKAAGMKPVQYFFGRFAALVTVNFAVWSVMAFFFLHLYVITRGGVNDLEVRTYLADSAVRLMRHLVFRAMPVILFYIGLTYCLGSLFKNGIAAAVFSVGYAVFYAVSPRISHRIDSLYFDYLSPDPNKLWSYWHFYDSERFENTLVTMNTNLGKSVLCVCILVGLGVLYSTIAYLRTRKRER